jgi:hypothetical protein
MEFDKDIVYMNVTYSTWNDHRFLNMNADSLNLSSSNLSSFIILNSSSFVQLNDAYNAYNAYNAYDARDAHNAHNTHNNHNVSSVKNRGLIHDEIFKILNTNIDHNCENTDFLFASTFDEQ